jgi:hypothetical protein
MITATHPRFIRFQGIHFPFRGYRREWVLAIDAIAYIEHGAQGMTIVTHDESAVILAPEEYDRLMAALTTGGGVLDLMEES